MTSFLDFFETIPPMIRTGLLAGGLVAFWLIESAIPLFAFRTGRYRHAAINLFFTLTTLLVNLALAVLIVRTADFTTRSEFGVLYLFRLPTWLHIMLGLLLLDLIGAYAIHWVEHRVRWLWKFHLIHHTDDSVDVTTGLRHHPGEAVFRAASTLVAILAAGVPIGVVLLYQTLSALFAQITHANIRSPKSFDRLLSLVFVTPNMHKIHHHFQQPLTDTNYGNIFSVWDRLFGTFASVESLEELSYGIDTHMKEDENADLGNLLVLPFQPYRPGPGAKFSRSSKTVETAGADNAPKEPR